MRKTIAVLAVATILSAATFVRFQAADLDSQPHHNGTTAAGELVVHEWGTFTTFSGSDGVFMDFRPLAVEHNDLPNYVFDRGSFANRTWLTKSRIWGRVRMETPVTYFYTDRIRTVDVQVGFPEGLLTEFYPPASQFTPPIDDENIFGKGEAVGNSSLTWKNVDLIPLSEIAPNITDPLIRQRLTHRAVHGLLPHAAGEQHYAAARETDSAIVHMRDASGANSYFEKFLFYRGVGKFQLPISSHFDNGTIQVRNDGVLPFNSAILIRVDGDELKAAKIDAVAPGQSVAFHGLRSVTQEQLVDLVKESLVAEGLFAKEAASMVKTWQQSWFTEQGTRVLYMVPAALTEELLPLNVTPQPEKMLRVLVGRMEIMSPSAEQKMLKAVATSAAARAQYVADKKAGVETLDAPFAIPEEIRNFGRMAEPAVARIAQIAPDAPLRLEAELLVKQFQAN